MAYIGRSGWNDLSFRGAIPDDELLEAVDDSYQLVVSAIPKKRRPEGWDARPARRRRVVLRLSPRRAASAPCGWR